MAQIQVRNQFGEGLPLINIRIGRNGQSSDESEFDVFTDYQGNSAFPYDVPSSSGYELYVNYRHVDDEYLDASIHVNDFSVDHQIVLDSAPLERVVGDGLFTKTESGIPFFYAHESAFLDYYRFLRGEDITLLLRKSYELGSKGRRNFLMTWNTAKAAGLPPFNPEDFGNAFYDRFPEFLKLYEAYRLYLYAAVFPDNKLFGSWTDQTPKQVGHWNKLCEIGKSIPNFYGLELTNEPAGHAFNQVDTNAFSEPDGILSCSGSYGDTGSDPMPDPQWSICDYHSPRDAPHYIKAVKDNNCMDHPSRVIKGKRILSGEPLGFGDPSINPRRCSDPDIAKQIAGSSLGTMIGVCFHSEHGGFSQPYDHIENPCAYAFFNVLRGI